MRLSFKSTLILIFLAWFTLAYPWLSGSVTVPWDAKAHWYPHFIFLHNAFKTGASVLWSPYTFAGMPEIADPQSAIFQIPMLLTSFFSNDLNSPDRVVLITIFIGMVSIIMLFKDKGEPLEGGVIAAIAFGFGASVCWRLQHFNQVTSTALLPLALVLLDRALERKSIIYGALAGLAASLILIGRDQVALLAIYWLFIYTCYRFYQSHNKKSLLLPLLAGGLVALLIIPIPFILTFQWGEMSNRPEIDEFSAGRGSLHPVNLLTLVIGNLFGAAGNFNEHWGAPSLHFKDTDLYLARNMNVLYMGILPVILLLNGLWTKSNRVYTFSALVFLLYALGKYTPAFTAIYHLPFINVFRRPADAVFLIGLFSAIAAGFAWNSSINWKRTFLILGAACIICLGVSYWKQTLTFAYDEIAIGFLSIILTIIALFFYQKKPSKIAFAILITIFILDIRITNAPSESTGLPPETYDVLRLDTKNETIAYLKANLKPLERVELRGLGYHWQNAAMVHGFYDILGFNPVRDESYDEIVGTEDIAAEMGQRRFTRQFTTYKSVLARQLGLRFLVTGKAVEGLTPVKTTKDAFIYEFTPLPRLVFEGGKITNFTYKNSEITITGSSEKGGKIIVRDVYHPWWFAEVNGEEADITRHDLLFRAVDVPAGTVTMKMTFKPFKGMIDEMR